jgi:tRNA splicing endonuclease
VRLILFYLSADPLRWHAHFVVVVLEWNTPLHALDFVSIGRLGNTVKKSPLLASVSPAGDPVYYTIDWQGVT